MNPSLNEDLYIDNITFFKNFGLSIFRKEAVIFLRLGGLNREASKLALDEEFKLDLTNILYIHIQNIRYASSYLNAARSDIQLLVCYKANSKLEN